MAGEEGGGIEMQDLNDELEEVDMSHMDYDLEYMVRASGENDPEDQLVSLSLSLCVCVTISALLFHSSIKFSKA